MERLRTVVAVLVAALVAGVATPAFHDQDIELQHQWVEGDELTYRITRDFYVRESCRSRCSAADWPDSNTHTVRGTLTEVRRLTVAEVAPDGTASVQVLLDSVKVDMELPPENDVDAVVLPEFPPSYDSAWSQQRSPGLTWFAQAMEALVGESISAVIGPTGTVKSVSGMPDISRETAVSLAPTREWVRAVTQLMNPRWRSDTLGQHFSYLPARAVPLGGSWQTTRTEPSLEFPQGVTISNTLKLESLEMVDGHEIARIGLSQAIVVAPGGPAGQSSQVSDASGEGEILFDRTRGRISQVTTQMTTAVTKPTGPNSRTHISTKTTVELIEG